MGWRWRQLINGRCKNKWPLIEALCIVLRKGLSPAWENMRRAVFHHRDMKRKLFLLYLAKARAMGELALGHYYRNLLRLGLAGFWIAVRLQHNTPRATEHGVEQDRSGAGFRPDQTRTIVEGYAKGSVVEA